jgi:predicted RNA binding protein YcfA (HicA-like mRNA interferase family)
MPKFPGLSGKDIVRALEKLGFQVARQSRIVRGSGVWGELV